MSSSPEASRSRTPDAEATGSGAIVPGIGAYGCQTRPRSSSASFSAGNIQPIMPQRARAPRPMGCRLPTASCYGSAAGAGFLLLADSHRHLHRGALEAELLAQAPLDEP